MSNTRICPIGLLVGIGFGLLVSGCEPIAKTPEKNSDGTDSTGNQPKNTQPPAPPSAPLDIATSKKHFAQMEAGLQSVASMPTSKKGPSYDYKFVMPSDDWQMTTHADGDRKASVWLFTSKKTGLKILVSGGGAKEDPAFAKSAQDVYESSFKKRPEVTREWKVGNFTLRRSFIGFIDERHGEATVTAFSPKCALEFNIGSESLDRDELFKFADTAAQEFIAKNPDGGFPSK